MRRSSLLLLLAWCGAGVGACGEDATDVVVPPVQPQCEASSQRACFSGPDERLDVGVCHAGVETCTDDGLGWGPCEDEVAPTREICGDDVDDDCDGITSCGETVWSRLFGVGRDEYAMRVEVDATGSIYLAGGYRDSFDLGTTLPAANTSRDVLLAKLAPDDGEPIWSVGISGTSNSFARDVAVAPDGRVALVASVAGAIDIQGGPSHPAYGGNDVLLALFDQDGSYLFSQRYGDGDEDHPMAVAFDPDGNVVVAGFFRGEIDFGTGPLSSGDYDAFVATIASDGTALNAQSFGGKGNDLPRAMALDATGAIYLVGEMAGDIDFGAGEVVSQGDVDAFVAVFEPMGTNGEPLELRWARTFGDAAAQTAYGVAVDDAGQVAITGRFAGELALGADTLEATAGGMFVSLLDATGRPLWARGLEGAANGGGWEVRFDSRGRVVVGGFYEGPAAIEGGLLPESGLREQNILLAKYEPDGTIVWGRGVRVSGDQSIFGLLRGWRALAVTDDDHIVLAGFAERSIELTPGDVLESQGGSDLLVAKLLP